VKRSKLPQILPSRRLSGSSRRLAARLARFQLGIGLMIARRFKTRPNPADRPLQSSMTFAGTSSTEHAARPLALVSEGGRTALLLDDPGGEPLDRLLGAPMEVERFLRLVLNWPSRQPCSAESPRWQGRPLDRATPKGCRPSRMAADCQRSSATRRLRQERCKSVDRRWSDLCQPRATVLRRR
jgi:hypothetical protein